MTSALRAQLNVPTELSLRVAGADVSGDELDLALEATAPSGVSLRVPAFWAGADEYRVRVAFSATGTHTYRLVGAAAGSTTGPTEGTIEVRPYTGTNELYRHGRIRVAEGGRRFEHTDGTPFFWLGDTQWQMFTTRFGWPGDFRELEGDRADKGFSVVQVVAGPLPDFDAEEAWNPKQANDGGWPWTADWAGINPGYYDIVDRNIEGLIELGLMPCVVGMWGFWLPIMGRAQAERHWRYLVARYGAYPVTWCLAGEVQMGVYANQRTGGEVLDADLAEQAVGWTTIASLVRELDPHHNVISVHPAAPDNGPFDERTQPESTAEVPGSGRSVLLGDVLDFDMLQPGHFGFRLLEPMVRIVERAVARQPRMPVVNAETNYEGIAGSSWEDQQRFQFWASITDGAAGYTYGAAGVWQFWTVDQFSKGGDSENVEDAGGGPWQEVMHLPGSRQVGIGRRFFVGLPWGSFQRIDEPEAVKLGRHSSFATGIPGVITVYYVPSGLEPEVVCGILRGGDRRNFWWRLCVPIAVPAGDFEAYWFNPRTGEETAIGPVVAEAGRWTPPPKPSLLDWVLVVVDRARLAQHAAGAPAAT